MAAILGIWESVEVVAIGFGNFLMVKPRVLCFIFFDLLVEVSEDLEVGFLLEGNYTVALSCQAGDDLPAPSDDDIAFIQPGDVEIIRDIVSEFDFAVIDEEVPVETTE